MNLLAANGIATQLFSGRVNPAVYGKTAFGGIKPQFFIIIDIQGVFYNYIFLFLGDSNLYSGCSAARLARFVRDEEVGSSNLPTPTLSVEF
jgi:hypothetical protein